MRAVFEQGNHNMTMQNTPHRLQDGGTKCYEVEKLVSARRKCSAMQQVCMGGTVFIHALVRHLRADIVHSQIDLFVEQGERKRNVGFQPNKKRWLVIQQKFRTRAFRN